MPHTLALSSLEILSSMKLNWDLIPYFMTPCLNVYVMTHVVSSTLSGPMMTGFGMLDAVLPLLSIFASVPTPEPSAVNGHLKRINIASNQNTSVDVIVDSNLASSIMHIAHVQHEVEFI